jgi:hypothetical protein
VSGLAKLIGISSNVALATIVERMQREFSLAADVSGSPEEPGELKSNV